MRSVYSPSIRSGSFLKNLYRKRSSKIEIKVSIFICHASFFFKQDCHWEFLIQATIRVGNNEGIWTRTIEPRWDLTQTFEISRSSSSLKIMQNKPTMFFGFCCYAICLIDSIIRRKIIRLYRFLIFDEIFNILDFYTQVFN